MKYIYLLGIFLAFASIGFATNHTNASVYNITRIAPFSESFVCSAINDTYLITAEVNLTNITIGNQSYNAIVVNNTPQLGIEYDVEFASSVQPNKTQINALFIHDYEGRTVQQRDWSFVPGETQEIRFKIPFFCPADLTPQINFQTCSQFFDEFINKDEPLLFTLATGTRQCQDELGNRTAAFVAAQDKIRELDNERVTLRAELTQKEEANKLLIDDLTDPTGSCGLRLADEKNITSTCQREKSTLVSGWWMWACIFFIILTGISFLKQFVW